MEIDPPYLITLIARHYPACARMTSTATWRMYVDLPLIRGLLSSTFRHNVSTFCWIRWVHDFPPVY